MEGAKGTIVNPTGVEHVASTFISIERAQLSDDLLKGDDVAWHFDGTDYPAERAWEVGTQTVVFAVQVPLGPWERQTGELVPRASPMMPDSPSIHPAVGDDLTALVPIWNAGTQGSRFGAQELRLEQFGRLFQVHRYSVMWGPYRAVWYATVWHQRPVLDISWFANWCPSEEGPTTHTIDGAFGLFTRELYLDHFGSRHGFSPPSTTQDGRYVINLGSGLRMNYGGAIYGVGQMICQEDAKDSDLWSTPEAQAASARKPIMAIGRHWSQPMGVGNQLAVDDEQQFVGQMRSELGRFYSELENGGPRSIYATPMMGIGDVPAGTGSKEVFGAIAGGRVWKDGQPDASLMILHGTCQDFLRPCAIINPTGNIVDEGSPLWDKVWGNLRIWSDAPLFVESLSPNQFGRQVNDRGRRDWSENGIWGYDDQHAGWNDLAASKVQMPGVFILRDLAKNRLNLCITRDRNRIGAPRAAGRLLQCYADMFVATGNRKWIALMEDKVQAVANAPSLNVDGPVKVIEWRGPDGRKKVFDPVTGDYTNWTSIWEQGGLFLVGAKVALRVLRMQASWAYPMLKKVMEKVAETVIDQGIHESGGDWFVFDDVRYLANGEANTQDLIDRAIDVHVNGGVGGTIAVVNKGLRGVGTWTFAGMLGMTDDFEGFVIDTTKKSKLWRFVMAMTGGRDASNIDEAEWRATRPPLSGGIQ